MPRHFIVGGRSRHLRGWRPDRPDHRDLMLHAVAELPHFGPTSDLRAFVRRVRDQGEVGCCTAEAWTSALALERAALGLPDFDFSALDLYYTERVYVDHVPPDEDSGAEIRDGAKALRRFGCCREELWPYADAESRYMLEPPPAAQSDAKTHLPDFLYYKLSSLDWIRASLAARHPVVIGFSVPESMMSDACAQTGRVLFPLGDERMVGGHAVLLVGHDDAFTVGAETGALVFLNSWGADWGDHGYGYLPYRFFTERLAEDPWAAHLRQPG